MKGCLFRSKGSTRPCHDFRDAAVGNSDHSCDVAYLVALLVELQYPLTVRHAQRSTWVVGTSLLVPIRIVSYKKLRRLKTADRRRHQWIRQEGWCCEIKCVIKQKLRIGERIQRCHPGLQPVKQRCADFFRGKRNAEFETRKGK